MSKLVSAQVADLQQKFRQFEHGGHCFGSDEIMAIVRGLKTIAADARALEDRLAAAQRRGTPETRPTISRPAAALPATALPIGTFYFLPFDRPGGTA